MSQLMRFFSLLGLVLTIGPPLLFISGGFDLDQVKASMLWGMLIWYGFSLLSSFFKPSNS